MVKKYHGLLQHSIKLVTNFMSLDTFAYTVFYISNLSSLRIASGSYLLVNHIVTNM